MSAAAPTTATVMGISGGAGLSGDASAAEFARPDAAAECDVVVDVLVAPDARRFDADPAAGPPAACAAGRGGATGAEHVPEAPSARAASSSGTPLRLTAVARTRLYAPELP